MWPWWTIGPCHTGQLTGNQFQAISKKKRHSYLNVRIFFLGIVRHCLKNYSCATKVVLYHAPRLVASKLPVKVASCHKAHSRYGKGRGGVRNPVWRAQSTKKLRISWRGRVNRYILPRSWSLKIGHWSLLGRPSHTKPSANISDLTWILIRCLHLHTGRRTALPSSSFFFFFKLTREELSTLTW